MELAKIARFRAGIYLENKINMAVLQGILATPPPDGVQLCIISAVEPREEE